MKKVKINFKEFWSSFDKENNIFTKMLRKHYDVEISDNPDFLFCGDRPENGVPFAYIQDECVRIQFIGEPFSPDFSVFDYSIGCDFMEFGDRYFRLPFAFFNEGGVPWVPTELSRNEARSILDSKKYFCNFTYGHRTGHGIREELFEKLNEYKHVISPGRYMNNMGTNGCSFPERKKYIQQSKFFIACENNRYPGYVTEKIMSGYENRTVPIYFGSTRIEEDINPESFIYCKDEDDIDNVVELVKKIDQDDEAYIDLLTKSPFYDSQFEVKLYEKLEEYLVHIFDQTPKEAQRRFKYGWTQTYQSAMGRYYRLYSKIPSKMRRIIK